MQLQPHTPAHHPGHPQPTNGGHGPQPTSGGRGDARHHKPVHHHPAHHPSRPAHHKPSSRPMKHSAPLLATPGHAEAVELLTRLAAPAAC